MLIRCDICKESSDSEDLAIVNEVQLRRDLKERGWQFLRASKLYDKEDRCPGCATGGKK